MVISYLQVFTDRTIEPFSAIRIAVFRPSSSVVQTASTFPLSASCMSVPGPGYRPIQTTWVGRTLSIAQVIWSNAEALADRSVAFHLPDDERQVTDTGTVPGIPGSAQGGCDIRAAVGIVNNYKVFFMT